MAVDGLIPLAYGCLSGTLFLFSLDYFYFYLFLFFDSSFLYIVFFFNNIFSLHLLQEQHVELIEGAYVMLIPYKIYQLTTNEETLKQMRKEGKRK